MKVLVSGGTGFIGRHLVKVLLEEGHEVSLLSRSEASPIAGAGVSRWDPMREYIDASALEGVDAVVHLAGDSIAGGPWTAKKRRSIRESRLLSTRLLVDTFAKAKHRPRVFVCASGAGYYGDSGEDWVDEEAAPGKDFLSGVCREWENEAQRAEALGVRVVRVRTGTVLGQGGFLAPMKWPFRLGLGAVWGDGRQYMSWIHIHDLAGIYRHAILTDRLKGAVNAGSPNPVTNRAFSRALASTFHRPLLFRVPAFVVSLLVRDFGRELLLAGQRMRADKIRDAGFSFRFENIAEALDDIFKS